MSLLRKVGRHLGRAEAILPRTKVCRGIKSAQIPRGDTINDPTFIDRLTTLSRPRRHATWEIIRGGRSLSICMVNSSCPEDLQLSFVPEAEIISLRFIRSGGLALRSSDTQAFEVSANTVSLHKMVAGRRYELVIPQGTLLQSATLHFHAPRFCAEIGLPPSEVPEALRSFVAHPAEPQVMAAMTCAMDEVVMNMVSCGFTGSLRRKYLATKAKELLYLFVAQIDRGLEDYALLEAGLFRHKEKFLAVRNLIVDDPIAMPAIEVIARRVGLNRTTLRKGFKGIFGVSITDYRREQLMGIARDILKDRALNIAEVAEALGYEHHANFTAAFRQYHGCSPSVYRTFRSRESSCELE